jgi:hypothetical protein
VIDFINSVWRGLRLIAASIGIIVIAAVAVFGLASIIVAVSGVSSDVAYLGILCFAALMTVAAGLGMILD